VRVLRVNIKLLQDLQCSTISDINFVPGTTLCYEIYCSVQSGYTRIVSAQRLGKHFPTKQTTEQRPLLGSRFLIMQQLDYTNGRAVFSTWSFPRGYKRHKIRVSQFSRVEAGSNTSTVAVRVVGGDKKGSLKSETVKYGRESHGTRTRE
jgi:hypothetical protein